MKLYVVFHAVPVGERSKFLSLVGEIIRDGLRLHALLRADPDDYVNLHFPKLRGEDEAAWQNKVTKAHTEYHAAAHLMVAEVKEVPEDMATIQVVYRPGEGYNTRGLISLLARAAAALSDRGDLTYQERVNLVEDIHAFRQRVEDAL